jgi:hypothetical protein
MANIHCEDRWQAYFRLRELDIPCRCQPHQPLQVQIDGPHQAMQLWSVMQQANRPRRELAQWLETCWQLSV